MLMEAADARPEASQAVYATVAQHVPASPSDSVPERRMNQMTPRQRQEYIRQREEAGARLRDALLEAIRSYPGGMAAVQKKVYVGWQGLSELIHKLADLRCPQD